MLIRAALLSGPTPPSLITLRAEMKNGSLLASSPSKKFTAAATAGPISAAAAAAAASAPLKLCSLAILERPL